MPPLVPVNLQVVLQLDSAAYDVFVGGTIAIPISEREGAIIVTMLSLLLDRNAWQEMSDTEWDAQLAEITEMIEKLST
jgi:hypothetical protein